MELGSDSMQHEVIDMSISDELLWRKNMPKE